MARTASSQSRPGRDGYYAVNRDGDYAPSRDGYYAPGRDGYYASDRDGIYTPNRDGDYAVNRGGGHVPSRDGYYAPAAPVQQAFGSSAREAGKKKRSLAPSRPVLWFLFLFNLAVAVAAGLAGNRLHVHGYTVQGAQVAAGMGVVALGAGVALLRRRGQRN